MRQGRSLLRTATAIALAVAALTALAPAAHAAPTTEDRRRVAEDVAATVCRTVPAIPKLPKTVEIHDLCQQVIIENVDPDGTNSGVHAACEAALPKSARAATRFCASVLDALIDPARTIFLDKVVPAAAKLTCIAQSPAAFDCLTEQVHVWLKQSIISLWQGLLTVLTSDTEVIALLDGWHNAGIVSLYSDVGSLGATLLLGVLLTSLIISAIRFDFRQFGSIFLGVVVWGMFWSGGVTIAVLLLKVSDQASVWLAGRADTTGQTDLDRAGKHFASWVDYVSGISAQLPVRPTYDPGSFTAILVCLLLIIAIVATLIALLMRNIALLLIILALPLTLAGAAGPKMTREWFTAALRMFVAMLLAKPLIVIAVRLGAVLVSVPEKGEKQATLSDALLGVALILIAGLLPGVIYKFSGGLMTTSAGSSPRSSSGLSGQTAQSMQSSYDMTRMIMERNAPRPALASGSASSAAGARAAAARVGGAAGPIGMAAMAGALAAGTIESGGRWLAGNAATGGGVFGDVDAPHVPAPPISRGSYGQGRPTQGTSSVQQAAAGAAHRSQTARVTLIQQPPSAPSRPALPSSGSVLVIPGTVVPDRANELPPAPKALPGRKADDE